MTTISANPLQPLADLLAALAAAVRAGDHDRAEELKREILQRLVSEADDRACVERQVNALLAELERPQTTAQNTVSLDMLNLERSGPAPEDAGAVYPVWFGTNRKPDGNGGFTSERHDHITRGRVEVYVPKAHRFGETGTSFWTKLKRLDFCAKRRAQAISRPIPSWRAWTPSQFLTLTLTCLVTATLPRPMRCCTIFTISCATVSRRFAVSASYPPWIRARASGS